MSYTNLNFVPGEILTAAKMNLMAQNDASFHDGTGLGDNTIQSSKLELSALDDDMMTFTISDANLTTGQYKKLNFNSCSQGNDWLQGGNIKIKNKGVYLLALNAELTDLSKETKVVLFTEINNVFSGRKYFIGYGNTPSVTTTIVQIIDAEANDIIEVNAKSQLCNSKIKSEHGGTFFKLTRLR